MYNTHAIANANPGTPAVTPRNAIPHHALVAASLHDPAYRAEWNRTNLAHAVAIEVIRYRADHRLSQRAMGDVLSMSQPQVARLERGDHNPNMETLMRLSCALGVRFAITVEPNADATEATVEVTGRHSAEAHPAPG